MKPFYTFQFILILSILFIGEIKAQVYTAIPDAAFEQYLIDTGIDSNVTPDGQVLTSEIEIVTVLDVSYVQTITDLTGIEDFITLINLDATNLFDVTSLDVSGLTALEDLNVAFCTSLINLNVTGCINLKNLNIKLTQLNSLDLNTCTEITTIDAYKINLQNLDLSGKTNLTTIDVSESEINSLNVAGCTALTNININETSIRSLDLSNNPAITSFGTYDASIQDVNLTNCVNLEGVSFSQCGSLTHLNLTNCPNIKRFDFFYLGNSFTSLDTSGFPNLESIYFELTNLVSLDLSQNPNLTNVYIYGTSLNSLDLRNGNNNIITDLTLYYTNLSCVSVDNDMYSTLNWTNVEDVVFSNDCSLLNTETNILDNITIFPNPSQELINISGLQELSTYKVYNLLGKTMLSGSVDANQPIAIQDLSTGIYFLKLNTFKTLKFIKM